MLKLLGLLAIVLLVLFVLAVKYLPWWGVVALVVGVVLFVRFVVPRLIGAAIAKVFTAPFQMKGAVLKDAAVTVHAITPAEPPASDPDEEGYDEDTDEEPDLPRLCYHLELTVTPQPPTGEFTHWEPDELRLVAPDAKTGLDEDDEGPEVALMYGAEVLDLAEGEDGYKVAGPHRVRLHIGALPDTRQVALAYYFEKFGLVDLPEVVEAPTV